MVYFDTWVESLVRNAIAFRVSLVQREIRGGRAYQNWLDYMGQLMSLLW